MTIVRSLLLPLALTTLLCPGCDRSSTTLLQKPSDKPLHLIISGDTSGWITPCGCTSNQSGGLLRRGTYLDTAAKDANILYADAGGAVTGNSAYQRVKFEAILRGERAMNLRAHNLGRAEAALGVDYLKSLAAAGYPLVSANTTTSTGQPILKPAVIEKLASRRIALIGVLSPSFATPNLNVTDPRQAILAYAQANRADYDALVVLAYLPTDELTALAAGLPEADAVIGGPTGQAMEPRMIGATLVGAATNKGKFLVDLDIPSAAGKPWSGRVVELNASYADDKTQLQNLHQYLDELARHDFTAAQAALTPPPPPGAPDTYRIAGSASCASCHQADDAVWHASAHARAWDTLKPRGFHVDPACLQCHVTGYGLPAGFESVNKSAATLAGVGCENCHGPSLAHVQNPKLHTPFTAADQCTRCHDHENSPNFNFALYWPKIQHGPARKEGP